LKKVLIITYYWPPSGGAGVQRWLKFTKYLRDFGWEPIIYTVENGEFPITDDSLLKDVPEGIEVIKHPIWEPYSFYKKLIGQKKEEKIQTGFLSENERPKLMESLSIWVRGNFFIPDARKFWIKPSVKVLTKYLENNDIDAIVSNGPPHTTHMIALGLKKKFKLPWLADFRDPWTNIDFYDKLRLSSFADKKHHRQERSVIENADVLVTVSENWAGEFKKLAGIDFEVITNGFDSDDFIQSAALTDKFSIKHIGSLNEDRNPNAFWEALNILCEKKDGFRDDLDIVLIGSVDISVKQSIEKYKLDSNFRRLPYVPHKEVVGELITAQLLLLPINDTPNSLGVIPGKLFEYLAAKRPIFCVGPVAGDSARIITSSGAGCAHQFTDVEAMVVSLEAFYDQYKRGTLEVNSNELDKYSRRNLTGKMSELLNKITE
jgi:glycosyltransferase involved in cell wall biosynthesis